MGVAGPDPSVEDLGSPRSGAYPMPPLPLDFMDKEFARVLNGNGFHVVTEPVARNYDEFDDRPACCGNNNCMPICPIGAQYSGDVHCNKAEDAGAQLIENAVVSRVNWQGDRVTGVTYLRPDGSSENITANIVVLAANGIETPKLMLMSADESQPDGIANGSGMVGRNLMDHPGVAVSFLWDKPVFRGGGPRK
ncbi:MAG: GMC family oxidoreductase [Rhodospirillaceae bacterium]|jgi:glucose dehydrogenase|nr:GMC family oxidoreductase [Rhodospirillaceae bacterium]